MEQHIPFIRIYIEEIKQISRSIGLLKAEKIEQLQTPQKYDPDVIERKINNLNDCLSKLEEAVNILTNYPESDSIN